MPAQGEELFTIAASFLDGQVVAKCPSVQVSVGDTEFPLAKVRRIDFDAAGATVATADNNRYTGAIRGLEKIKATLTGAPLKMDWNLAKSITISPENPTSASYVLTVRDGETTVADVTGAITLDGAGAAAGTDLWAHIRNGIAANRTRETRFHGGAFNAKNPFTDMPQGGGYLVGFRITLGEWGGHRVLESLQPLYQTPSGLKTGNVYGTPTSAPTELRARPGYAVAGIHMRGGGNLDGIEVTYARLEGTRTNPEDSHVSPWYGIERGNEIEGFLGTNGGLAVGISGKSGDKIAQVALIVLAPEGENPDPIDPRRRRR
jgi:hypothetical protein